MTVFSTLEVSAKGEKIRRIQWGRREFSLALEHRTVLLIYLVKEAP